MRKKSDTKEPNSSFDSAMRLFATLLIMSLLFSCGKKKDLPDISGIKVELNLRRFEQDFFRIDSMQPKGGLSKIITAYPDFAPLFISNVLGLGSINDSNPLIETGMRRFLHLNQTIYKSTIQKFSNTNDLEKELTLAFRYLKYYFPNYKVPTFYTTIGPMDALPPLSNGEPSPNFMGTDFIAIGLQFYQGRDYPLYQEPAFVTNIVPAYRSRRFSKEYITSDIMKLVIDDIYPDSSARLPLGEQFIEKGKRLYMLSSFLPETHDTIVTGYTSTQLEWCKENEREIYNYFLQQQLFYERDPSLIMPYINDGPFTPGMPETSPGNTGAFLGLQFVKAYVKRYKDKKNPVDLLKIPAGIIIKDSGYKPR